MDDARSVKDAMTMNGYHTGYSYGQQDVKYSDLRVVKGLGVYTGAFSRPTGPLTKTGGTYPNNTNRTDPTASETKYLANFTNGDIIDLSGTSNFGFSAASNAQSDTGNQKYSVPSVLFDGSGDVINVEAFSSDKGTFWAEEFCKRHSNLVAVDESTCVKNYQAKRTRNIIKLRIFIKIKK